LKEESSQADQQHPAAALWKEENTEGGVGLM
jgi:hypothetical protein